MRILTALGLFLAVLAGAGSIVSMGQAGDATDTAEAARQAVEAQPSYLPSATVEQMLLRHIGAPERDRPSATCVRGEGNLYDCSYRDVESPRSLLRVRAEQDRLVIVRDRTPPNPS